MLPNLEALAFPGTFFFIKILFGLNIMTDAQSVEDPEVLSDNWYVLFNYWFVKPEPHTQTRIIAGTTIHKHQKGKK